MKIHEGDRLIVEKPRSVGKSEAVAMIWQKACACQAPSVTDDIRIEARPDEGSVVFVATYSPGPVCSNCRKEWRRVDGRSPRRSAPRVA